MNLLVLGGTVFLGRHLVQAALDAGDTVTIFTRGLHNGDLFPDVEKLRGDRGSDISALRGREWDAVVDTSGYLPVEVRRSAELLADSVGHYTFISSLSVYSDNDTPDQGEEGAVETLENAEAETEVAGETYGPLKYHCEVAAEESMPGRTASIRAGLIVGPWDPSDRFTYWPHRISKGGRVLAPGRPRRVVQFIDARDLAEWILSVAHNRYTGTFNATGPEPPVTMEQVLESCVRLSGSDAELIWRDDAFLKENGVGAWMEMPLWIPEGEGMDGFNHFRSTRAIEHGLTFRSLDDTVRATLEWDDTLPAGRQLRAGLAREKEESLLAG